MTRDQLAADVAITITDLSAKVRELILGGNGSEAANYASALRDACSGYDYLVPHEEG